MEREEGKIENRLITHHHHHPLRRTLPAAASLFAPSSPLPRPRPPSGPHPGLSSLAVGVFRGACALPSVASFLRPLILLWRGVAWRGVAWRGVAWVSFRAVEARARLYLSPRPNASLLILAASLIVRWRSLSIALALRTKRRRAEGP